MPLPSSSFPRNLLFSASSSKPFPAGILLQKNANNQIVSERRINPRHDIVVGRDRSQCQYVIDDPCMSKKHLRLYTIVYDNDEPTEVDTLVYAEDLSRNGVYWNGSLIGRGNGGFLLSEGDVLKLSPNTLIEFKSCSKVGQDAQFDLLQEQEMRRFRKNYVLTDRLLGAGAFGRVFMGIEQSIRTQLACKVVDLRKLRTRATTWTGQQEQPAAAENVDSRVQLRKVKEWSAKQKRYNKLEEKLTMYYREVEILSSISHPNIIGLEKVFITDNTIYMFQDLITAGDLFSYIEMKNGKLLEVEAAVVTRQIVLALCFLHERNIVHRDLKPDNILMTSLSAGCRVVLTDFGAARRIQYDRQRMQTLTGTLEYAAPEILEKSSHFGPKNKPGYTKAVDMWSLGCVAVVLLTGGSAFSDPTTQTYSEKLAMECNLDYLRGSTEWQAVRHRPKSFVEGLLQLDEDARLTATQALDHSWFSNDLHKTNFEDLYQRTIRHWRPRMPRSSMVEFVDSETVKYLPCSQAISDRGRRGRGHGFPGHRNHPNSPVESSYKPFPRRMHLSFWPKKKPGIALMSTEVRSAIKEHWSPKSKDSTPPKIPGLLPNRAPDGRSSSAVDAQARKPSFGSNGNRSNPKGRGESTSLPSQTELSTLRSKLDRLSSSAASNATESGHGTADMVKIAFTLRPKAESSNRPQPEQHQTVLEAPNTTIANTKVQEIKQRDKTKHPVPLRLEVQSSHQPFEILGDDFLKQKEATGDGSDICTVQVQNTASVQLRRLKRWKSSSQATQSSATPSSKRRRSSIFDIEEDSHSDDVNLRSPNTKRQRFATRLQEQSPRDKSSVNSLDGITPFDSVIPHHISVIARGDDLGDLQKRDLYLPR